MSGPSHSLHGAGARRLAAVALAVVLAVAISGITVALEHRLPTGDPARGPAATAPNTEIQPDTGAAALAEAGTTTANRAGETAARTDQVLVRWRARAGLPVTRSEAAAAPRVSALARATRRDIAFVRMTGSGAAVYKFDGTLGEHASAIVAAIAQVDGVATVEPDYWVTAGTAPNDTNASALWGLLAPADGGSVYGINATEAWAAPFTAQGAGVRVAVLDTGIAVHDDLTGQTVAGYDMIADLTTANDGDGRDADPSDPGDWCGSDDSSWHGTHVTGTIVALANNAKGVFGGAPAAKVQPVRVLGKCGGYNSDVADGILWASGNAVPGVPLNTLPSRILNLSLGGYHLCSAEEQNAITAARASGALVIVAAGNSSDETRFYAPASCTGVLTVAATGSNGKRAWFSNYGPAVEIAGPGVNIQSTIDSGTMGPAGPTYEAYDGTSMASPHVAVAAALIASKYPALPADGIAAALEGTVTQFAADATTTGCRALGCGAGVANATSALTALAADPPIVARPRTPVAARTGAAMTVTANVVDRTNVGSAGVSLDGGAFGPMTAVDGAFGGVFETVAGSVTAPAGDGPHTICVQAADTAMHVSAGTTAVTPAACTTFVVDNTAPLASAALLSPAGTPAPGTPRVVSSRLTDLATEIAAGRLQVDGGVAYPMMPRDGLFNTTAEFASGIFGATGLAISGGGSHSCALTSGGSIACWGRQDGGIGDDSGDVRTIPGWVNLGAPVIQVAAGTDHTCAIRSDGVVGCWGFGAKGALGTGSSLSFSTPRAMSGVAAAVAVGAGGAHTCVVLADGTAKCTGFGANGERGDNNAALVLALTAQPVSGLTGATGIVAGANHTCALLATGGVRCWGLGTGGRLGNGGTTSSSIPVAVSGLTDAVALSGGDGHTCALRANGTVACWGDNARGALGDGTTTSRSTPVAVAGLAGVTSIGAGGSHTCAVLEGGAVRCWGRNADGELGDGTVTSRTSPVAVPGAAGIVAVSGAQRNTCAVKASGGVVCWGDSWDGGLGDGTPLGTRPSVRVAPVDVAGFGPPLAVGNHAVCVTAVDAAGNAATQTGPACTTVIIVAGAPDPPRGVEANAGATTATVSWTPPPNTGGSAITGYAVTGSPSGTCSGGAGDTSCVVSGLTPGTRYTFAVTATNAAGTGRPAISGAVIPSAGTFKVTPTATSMGTSSSSSVAVRLSWTSGLEPLGAGDAYQAQRATGAGAFGSLAVASPTSSTASFSLAPNVVHAFRARLLRGSARSAWAAASGVAFVPVQDTSATLKFGGSGWKKSSTSTAYGGSVRYHETAGRTATVTFSGRAAAWVSTKGRNRGKAEVWVDGKRVKTLDLYASSTRVRQVVWSMVFPTAGTHTVRIKVLGAKNSRSTGKRVDIDAILQFR